MQDVRTVELLAARVALAQADLNQPPDLGDEDLKGLQGRYRSDRCLVTADLAIGLGQFRLARERMKEVLSQPAVPMASVWARLGLAELDRIEGDEERAVQAFVDLADRAGKGGMWWLQAQAAIGLSLCHDYRAATVWEETRRELPNSATLDSPKELVCGEPRILWMLLNLNDDARAGAHLECGTASRCGREGPGGGSPRPSRQAVASEMDGGADSELDPIALARWSAEILDTRGGNERREAPATESPPARAEALIELAQRWGMIETRGPQRETYEATILLGGTTIGNHLRTGLANRCAEEGTQIGVLVAASAERHISDSEHRSDPGAVGESDEWENLLRNVAEIFGPVKPEAEEAGGHGGRAWKDATFSSPRAEIRLLVAPPQEGRARANTGDVLSFLQSRLSLPDHPRLLLITSAIYVPYQFFVAAPALLAGHAQYVELIGTATAIGHDQQLLAQRLAQETHAAISAAVSVLESTG